MFGFQNAQKYMKKTINSFLMTIFGKNSIFFKVLKGNKRIKIKNVTLDFHDFSVGRERAHKHFFLGLISIVYFLNQKLSLFLTFLQNKYQKGYDP